MLSTLSVGNWAELAAEARELDMRASPYDLSGYGFAPIRVEEPAGRAGHVRRHAHRRARRAVVRGTG